MTTREERTRREPKVCTKRQFGGAARVISPAGVTVYAEKIPTTTEKLGRVPRWQRGLVQLPRRLGPQGGKYARGLETLEPSFVS